MLMPWNNFEEVAERFLDKKKKTVVLGCLSFESRCRFVPEKSYSILSDTIGGIFLLEIIDPPNCTPDYTEQAKEKRKKNEEKLNSSGIPFISDTIDLLATEDELIEVLSKIKVEYGDSETLIFDISSFPKRFFCIFLKRYLNLEFPKNLIITYTQAKNYPPPEVRLAEDVQAIASLPGFSGTQNLKKKTITISLGFETFNLKSIIEEYSENKVVKFLMSFPPNGDYIRRQWKVLRDLLGDGDLTKHIEVVSALDAELVYTTLEKWNQDSEGLVLVPFGPKPHSLGMSIFAINNNSGMYYSQPKVYNPNYAEGIGNSWAYVVKWDGIPCFKRHVHPV